MTRSLRTGMAATLLMLSAAVAAHAQDAPSMYQLVLRDGSRMYGTVEKDTPEEVVMKTPAGVVVTAQRSQVVSLKPATGRIVAGEFQPADPNTTRLFFAPTGRALRRGEAYVGVHQFIVPAIQVGITDRLSIGGGTPLLFFGDGDGRPFWITPKLQLLDTGRVQVAAGAFHGWGMDGDAGGIGYVVATFGSAAGSVTGGGGVAYAGDGGRTYVAMFGADRQIRRNMKLISENYVWGSGDGLVSAGLRFFGEQLSADVALGAPLNVTDAFVFPIVNFVYRF